MIGSRALTQREFCDPIPPAPVSWVWTYAVNRDESNICHVEAAGLENVNNAVDAARAAFNHDSWREISGTERGLLMFKLADLVERHKEVLATIETWDNGKPYSDPMSIDLPEVVNTIRYYAGYADKIHGQTIPTIKQKFAYTLREPIGVCAQIIPVGHPNSWGRRVQKRRPLSAS